MCFIKRIFVLLLVLGASLGPTSPQREKKPPEKPNLIFILADDLGYGDVGCYGQEKIKTPSLDRLAAEGMRFTNFYAGSPVCAPSRCVLMTGKHTGHCTVRGNAPATELAIQTLRDEDKTIAEVFKDAGYVTAQFGKWGLGEIDTSGHPNRQGFDYFFGYLNQSHAHNYYPSFLIRNSEPVPLKNVQGKVSSTGAGWAKEKVQYSHDLIMEEAVKWLEKNHDRPFFIYLSVTIPHANNEAARELGDGMEVPDYGIYADKDWPNPEKGKAAMITRMDRDIGKIMATLKEYGIDKKTIIMFSSDNGPHKEGGNDPDFFKSSGPFRGIKRSLYEGGIRMPMIVRWPGKIPPGSVSEHVGYFGDVLTVVSELTGQPVPKGLDSISFLPTLLGKSKEQRRHEYLYWEFYEQGGRQAVRFGRWKAIREPIFTGKIQLYDLSKDIGETKNVADAYPEIVKKAAELMKKAHVPDPNWRVRP